MTNKNAIPLEASAEYKVGTVRKHGLCCRWTKARNGQPYIEAWIQNTPLSKGHNRYPLNNDVWERAKVIGLVPAFKEAHKNCEADGESLADLFPMSPRTLNWKKPVTTPPKERRDWKGVEDWEDCSTCGEPLDPEHPRGEPHCIGQEHDAGAER